MTEPSFPPGADVSPGQRDPEPPGRFSTLAPASVEKGSRAKAGAAIAAVLAIVAYIVLRIHAPADVTTATATAAAHGTGAATIAPPSNPFDRTAAATYPQGEAGIVLPEPAPVGDFTTDQVAAALQQAKRAMVAARLDPTLVVSRDSSVLVGLFAPDARPGIQEDFAAKAFMNYATELGPGQHLTTDPVRDKGTITLKQRTTTKGIRILDVMADFVWAYPFAGTLSEPGDHLVVIHDHVSWGFPADADVATTSRGMFMDGADSFVYNMDCTLMNESLLGLGTPVPGDNLSMTDAQVLDPHSSIDQTPFGCPSTSPSP